MAANVLTDPAAWLPMGLSVFALIMILAYLAVSGLVREPAADEGAPARIFQIMMVAQVIIMAFFATKWLPRAPKLTAAILAVQVGFAAVPALTILYLERGLY